MFRTRLVLLIIKSQIMKKIIVIISLFLFSTAWASEDCKKLAQELVDVREDYKSLAALRGDIAIRRAGLGALSGARYAEANGEIRNLEINGQIVFNHMGGAKGDQLYKKAYAQCVTEEKEIADRQAKQEARAKARDAAKAARENK